MEVLEEKNEDKMIRATTNAGTTKDDLIEVFCKNGLTGVYNLGLKNMLDYLNDERGKNESNR